MSADQAIALIGVISSLLGALAWPAIGVFVLIRFREPISTLIAGLQQISLKGPGFELTGTRATVAASLAAAQTARDPAGLTPDDARMLATTVTDLVTADSVRGVGGGRLLWVDDQPANNRFEAAALRALGIHISTVRTTEEALAMIARERFDLIISDMGRAEGDTAGYDLLQALRATGDDTPFVIYAGSDSAAHRTEAARRGAQGSTNRPEELLRLALRLTRPSR